MLLRLRNAGRRRRFKHSFRKEERIIDAHCIVAL